MKLRDKNVNRDKLFIEPKDHTSDFKFDDKVVEVFDDMISRSVPLYMEQQEMITEIGKYFSAKGTNTYDLGCSTATTLINLCYKVDSSICLIGYDNSLPMIKKAKEKIEQHGFEGRIEVRYGDLNGDLDEIVMENASLVTLCWTLQFIRPLKRGNLIRKIYDSLIENGVLLLTEKILTNNSLMNRFFVNFYYDHKYRNGYTKEEIDGKREALENVLIPYRIDENIEMLTRNGFEIVETYFQWYNFAGLICIKEPA